MNKVKFEWQVGETDWDEDGELYADEPTLRRPGLGQRWRALPKRLIGLTSLVTLLVLAVVAWRMWEGYQEGFNRIRRDIQVTTDLEAWAWLTRDTTLTGSLISTNASAGWRNRTTWIDTRIREWSGPDVGAPQVELSDLELRNDIALVKATVALSNTNTTFNAYTEYRFYERDQEGVWKRTSPDARFWGEERRLKSEHFQVVYRSRDHAAVRAFLPRAEAFYSTLRRDLKLDQAEAKPFVIHIVPQIETATWRLDPDLGLTMVSPALLPTSLGYWPEDRLLRSLAFPLSVYLVEQALEQAPRPAVDERGQWSRFLYGLTLWLALDGAPLPTAWQAQLEADFRRDLASGRRLTLMSVLSLEADTRFGPISTSRMVAATLAEYIAAQYGRAALGDLLQAIPSAKNWDELLQKTLMVESAELEDGWRAYVDQRYRSRPDPEATPP